MGSRYGVCGNTQNFMPSDSNRVSKVPLCVPGAIVDLAVKVLSVKYSWSKVNSNKPDTGTPHMLAGIEFFDIWGWGPM